MPRSKELQALADVEAIKRSYIFTTVRFVGRSGFNSPWDRRVFQAATYGSRERALTAALVDFARGCNDGRRPCLYAVTPEGYTIHIEEKNFPINYNGPSISPAISGTIIPLQLIQGLVKPMNDVQNEAVETPVAAVVHEAAPQVQEEEEAPRRRRGELPELGEFKKVRAGSTLHHILLAAAQGNCSYGDIAIAAGAPEARVKALMRYTLTRQHGIGHALNEIGEVSLVYPEGCHSVADLVKVRADRVTERANGSGERRTFQRRVPAATPTYPKEGSKNAMLLDMVSRPEGATMQELLDATGWKACRGALGAVVSDAGKALIRTDDTPPKYRAVDPVATQEQTAA